MVDASVVESTVIPDHWQDGLFIDGRWMQSATGDRFDVADSTTEQIFLSVPAGTAADIDRAVGAARRAFDEGPWPLMSHRERAGYLRSVAAELRRHVGQIAAIWPRQSGVLHTAALSSAAGMPDVFDFYAGLAEDFPFEEPHTPKAGRYALLVREPVGVVGAIIPWNGPLSLITCKLAPALLAGCTVVLKASPEAPAEACVIADIAERIGLPAGVINVVTADREVSELLVRDPRVDKIAFTGSTAAGRRIASLIGERIGRYTLELGGKSAAVVLEDFDPAEAAATLAAAECHLSGQVCASLTRIIVNRRHHDEFAEALAETFARVRVGDPFDAATQMGPLASAAQREQG